MKDIYAILAGLNIEVPEDKKATLDKEWKENYRTVAEYTKATAKRDELQTSLDTVQEQLKTFEGVNPDEYKKQLGDLTKQLEDERAARAADESKHQLDATIDKFMGGKQFVNDLTANSLRELLADELGKESAKGRAIEEIFKTLVSDKDGNQMPNILVDQNQQAAQQNAAVFTQPKLQKPQPGTKMSIPELMKLKNANPDLDVSQYMHNE